jgi:thymidylate synthase
VFSQSLSADVSERFPIITGRKIFPKIFNTEFNWFINGETNIKRFQEAGVTIWDSWADENGDLGPVYGHQLLNFNDQQVNQLKSVINSLKTDPDSRRHVISLWNPAQLDKMALPPCYLYFQFYITNGKDLNLFVLQRSGDVFLGVPYDIALFTVFLNHVAKETELQPKILKLEIIDAHIYNNQISKVQEYLGQETYPLPSYEYINNKCVLKGYISGPRITCAVAV